MFVLRFAKAIRSLPVLAALCATPGLAADMLADPAAPYTQVEFGTGWYLRGDVGVTFSGIRNEQETTSSANGNQFSSEIDEDSVVSYGIGVGRRFTANLRGDITLENFATVERETRQPIAPNVAPCANGSVIRTVVDGFGNITTTYPDAVIDNCVEGSSNSFHLVRGMVNGYYDFGGDFLGFRPFVGGGVGLVRNRFTSAASNITCTPTTEQRCGPTDGGTADFGQAYTQQADGNNGVGYHLMGALHAGVSYAISDNLNFDVAYSYAKLVDEPLFGSANGIADADVPTDYHTVKVGLRYEIW